jgi:hypothetical protein
MKLFELDATRQTKQAAKVFESYFGNSISFETLTRPQARNMLNRVRSLIKEHRGQPSFHQSEKNPAYLKLVVMEQGLAAKLREFAPATPGAAPVAAVGAAVNPANMAMQMQQQKKQIQDAIKQKQQEITQLQKQLNMPNMGMAESRARQLYRQLHESEIQQAQVVLASQDMVDEVQKMLEQVTSMQFKDLPALVDQVKNQVGQEQATQFNGDASAALGGLVQNLQGAKQQLEQALGVVTGQAAVVPGEAPAGDMGTELPPTGEELPPAPPEGEEEIDVDLEEPLAGPSTSDLGRAKR